MEKLARPGMASASACSVRIGSLTSSACVCAIGIGMATSALAQEDREPLPARAFPVGELQLPVIFDGQFEQRLREIQEWIAEYQKWSRWNETWRNKPEPGWIRIRERRARPDPPPWLAGECRGIFITHEGILSEACRLLADWDEDPQITGLRARTAKARTQPEASDKIVWWEHIHLDALWPMAQPGSSVFGVLGVHATFEVAGRFQIFAAPGAILLNLPNGNAREWRPATDWGIAYRCFDFTFPGTDRRASLHLNLAKAWVIGGPSNVVKSSIDLAGFSVTFKKTPAP
jgi:hypothetical protein